MSHINGRAAHEYRARFGEEPGSREPAAESERWQQVCQELAEEKSRLHNELANTQEYCEQYRRLAQKLLPWEYNEEIANLTAEQALELALNDQSLKELIEEDFPD